MARRISVQVILMRINNLHIDNVIGFFLAIAIPLLSWVEHKSGALFWFIVIAECLIVFEYKIFFLFRDLYLGDKKYLDINYCMFFYLFFILILNAIIYMYYSFLLLLVVNIPAVLVFVFAGVFLAFRGK